MYGRVKYIGGGAVDDVYKTLLASTTSLKLDVYRQRYTLHVAGAAVVRLLDERAEVRS